ncbi:MAG: TlpA disulfide reductase family protein [Actinomycetota bacterium]
MSNRVKRTQPSRVEARKQQAASVQSLRRWGVAAVLAFGIVIVVVGGVFVFGGDDGDDDAAGISFNGVALPTLADGTDPAIGLKAPIFVTTDLATGDRVVVGGGGGPNDTAKVVLFAAHWCPLCQEEIPVVADWLRSNSLPDGVEVVAVSTFPDAGRANHPPADWFAGAGWPYPVMADDESGAILGMFGMSRVPSWVVLDDRNVVVTRVSGALDAAGLEALVALAGTS